MKDCCLHSKPLGMQTCYSEDLLDASRPRCLFGSPDFEGSQDHLSVSPRFFLPHFLPPPFPLSPRPPKPRVRKKAPQARFVAGSRAQSSSRCTWRLWAPAGSRGPREAGPGGWSIFPSAPQMRRGNLVRSVKPRFINPSLQYWGVLPSKK